MTVTEFGALALVLIGGPLGILRWWIGKRWPDIPEELLKGALATLSVCLAWGLAHFIAPMLSIAEIGLAAAAAFAGQSAANTGTATVPKITNALRAKPDQPIDANGPP